MCRWDAKSPFMLSSTWTRDVKLCGRPEVKTLRRTCVCEMTSHESARAPAQEQPVESKMWIAVHSEDTNGFQASFPTWEWKTDTCTLYIFIPCKFGF